MRLIVDLQSLQTASKYRGIGRYVRSLTRALLRNKARHDIWVALRNGPPNDLEEIRGYLSDLLPNDRFFVFSLFSEINYSNRTTAWQRETSECLRAFSLALLRPDFVLTPSMIEGFDEPVATSCRPILSYQNCAIVHDLIPFHDPEPYIGTAGAVPWYQEKLTELLFCDFLFCNSEYTRKDLLTHLHYRADATHTVSAGSEYRAQPPTHTAGKGESDRDILSRLGIDDAYILHTGSLEPRKNSELLLRGFALLPTGFRQNTKIVFAGSVLAADRARIEACAREVGLRQRQLHFVGFIPENELAALYRGCMMFVFPSLAEGFGLPALEAMACGAPTLSSNSTSLPEVIGRSDLLFDPRDPSDLRDKMLRIFESPAYRDEVVAYGLRRSQAFSWDSTARQILTALDRRAVNRKDVYDEVDQSRTYFDYLRTMASLSAILARHQVDQSGRDAVFDLLRRNSTAAAACMKLARPTWRIEGPFDSSYSLSLVNREAARSLTRLGVDVSLFSTEGPGDFDPNPDFLQRTPDIDQLYRHGLDPAASFTVVSRNLFPPRVTGMNGALNLLHNFAWEESGFPLEWVETFNEGLTGIACTSSHVRKILIDHGVRLPMAVTGNGIDHWAEIQSGTCDIEAKAFRFLHVSSSFPRKGVDCLLEAYGRAFRKQDDVSLIIKTTPNPHNTVPEDLARMRAADPDFPDVAILDRDLSAPEMKALYRQCHAFVAPSRAEGFGLPVAEAILEGLPVIVTGWSGHLDFCNSETAWILNYRFERAQTHFNLRSSVWAQPNVAQLATLMKEVRGASAATIQQKIDAGRELLHGSYTWNHVGWRLQCYVADLVSFSLRQRYAPKIGWVSSWNTRCGIASYSRYMLRDAREVSIFAHFSDAVAFPDDISVIRDWERGGATLDQAYSDIIDSECNVIVIQFNYAFFAFSELANLIERLLDRDVVVVIEAHAVHEKDPDPTRRLATLVPVLRRCQRIVVHSIRDMNELKDMGLVENVTLFPHPYLVSETGSPAVDQSDDPRRIPRRPIVASYGFFLPNKGLLQLIRSIAELAANGVDAQLVLVNAEYPDPISRSLIEEAKELVSELSLQDRVTLITDFLTDEDSLLHLGQADLIVLPYQSDAMDSASGAVRLCLASGRPIAVTPAPIFDDVEGAVIRLPGFDVSDLALGIRTVLNDIAAGDGRIREVLKYARQLTSQFSYARMSRQYFGMLEALYVNREFNALTKRVSENSVLVPGGCTKSQSQETLIKTEIGRIWGDSALQSQGQSESPHLGIIHAAPNSVA